MMMMTTAATFLKQGLANNDPGDFPVPGLSDLRILVLDNYDSFTYNLVQYLGEISGAEIKVFRNDCITVKGVREEDPTHLVVSPGPCTPNEAGISLDTIHFLAGHCPILGVCLGHQSIGQVYGGQVVRGAEPVHGKTSLIHHDGRTIFAELPEPFVATRYHSLILHPELPPALECTAWTADGVVMGVRHREYVVEGVQFHPESLLTVVGKDLLRNFLSRREARWDAPAGPRAATTPATTPVGARGRSRGGAKP